MAKITSKMREEFAARSEPYNASIKQVLEKEKSVLATISQNPEETEHKKLGLVDDMLYAASLYIGINSLSVSILDVRNNDILNDARKLLYKAVIYLEEVLTPIVDAPFSDYEERLLKVADVPITQRYYLVRKLGLAINMMTDAFGENSKWRWSFVELEGRYAAVAKNFLDMKLVGKSFFDPNAENYETIVLYTRLVRRLLDKVASGFRDKYELSSRRLDDMRNGIMFLSALRRLLIIINERDEAEEVKKKAQVWRGKMDNDHRNGLSN